MGYEIKQNKRVNVRTARKAFSAEGVAYVVAADAPRHYISGFGIVGPAWLNDPIYYHNRGNTNWFGESATYGDFVGLDDVATEHPRVVAGMIDIYGSWIDRFGIDGFRIDTARHVNPEFWQAFEPSMMERAKAKGCHAGINALCDALGYSHPTPIEPMDEVAELQKQFIQATEAMQALSARLELLTTGVRHLRSAA